MLGLKIKINGVFFAGIAPLSKHGVASVILSLTKKPPTSLPHVDEAVLLQSGAIDTDDPTKKTISSWPNKPISIGDSILIEVTSLEAITCPERTDTESIKTAKTKKMRYFKKLKKELKA